MAPQALEATNTAQAEPNWSISEQNQNCLATQTACWENTVLLLETDENQSIDDKW